MGTGNYNDDRARVHDLDDDLVTAVCRGRDRLLYRAPRATRIRRAPAPADHGADDLRARLLKLIGRERPRAQAGQPAEIIAR